MTFQYISSFTVPKSAKGSGFWWFIQGDQIRPGGDWLWQTLLAENVPGGPFSEGDTYLRDSLPTE